jgi:hypothetical protein
MEGVLFRITKNILVMLINNTAKNMNHQKMHKEFFSSIIIYNFVSACTAHAQYKPRPQRVHASISGAVQSTAHSR